MAKIIKNTARGIGILFEWILVIVIVFSFAIRSSYVQTKLASFATDYLSKELKTTVRLEKLDVVFINQLDLKGFFALDLKGDTLADVRSLRVELGSIKDLFKNTITIKDVSIEDGLVKIYKEKDAQKFNFQFIVDYFSSDKPKKKKKSPVFILKNTSLKNIRFHYDNYNIEKTEHGLDYSHLLFSELNLSVSQFQIKKNVFSAIIKNLSTYEVYSGFRLQEFKTKAIFSSKGIDIRRTFIKTDDSEIRSKRFQLIYNGFDDFSSFIDSVKFDADLTKSVVSMKDIAVFAPTLYGMDQVVFIDGEVDGYVKDLKLKHLVLKTGDRTQIKGDFQLPDFRSLDNSFYQERIDYVYADIKDLTSIKLPSKKEPKYLSFDPLLQRLGFFEGQDIRLDGLYSQFVISAELLNTRLGSVNMDNGIHINYNQNKELYEFRHSEASSYDFKVNKFDLGKLLASSNFGIVDGFFFLSGEAKSFSEIQFTSLSGNINQFDLLKYSYTNIEIKEGSFIDKVLYAKVDMLDRNINLSYDGVIDLNGVPEMNMNVEINKAFLKKLKLTDLDSTVLNAKMDVHLKGFDPNTMHGNVTLYDVLFEQGDKQIEVPNLSLDINRDIEEDYFKVTSSLIDATVIGKMNFESIGYVIQDQLSQIFPGFGSLELPDKVKAKKLKTTDNINYDIKIKDISQVLDVFVPTLRISPNTIVKGNYNAIDRDFFMKINADTIVIAGKRIRNISLSQSAIKDEIHSHLNIQNLQLNDSVVLGDINLLIDGNGNDLTSVLTWNPNTVNQTDIKWHTSFESTSRVNINFEPSYFSVNGNRWNINESASATIDSTTINVNNFRLEKGEQFISLNGIVSKKDSDKLNFQVNELNLGELAQLLGLDITLSGEANGWGYMTNPYTNLGYMGDLSVSNLWINGEEVGNIFLQSQWDKSKDKIALEGDLIYKDNQTFDFKGTYDITNDKENLDFTLNFAKTNIAFLNAFMDPLVVEDVRGFIDGKLYVTGSVKRPIIDGDLYLNNAGAKIAMLGTSFTFNGKMYADKDGFYIDNMPITDAEGNSGSLNGTIAHQDFTKWNFDVYVNLEEDHYKKNPKNKWEKAPLERFLAMNTDESRGDVYYGKAYVTGTVNVFGYLSNLDINVDVKTQRGTWINLSLFGQTELDEDNFITFLSKDSLVVDQERKIDFTGVSMDFKFNVTPDAQVKVVLNEQTGDEITAFGNGFLGLKLDNLGQMTLDGTYRVAEGSGYNFVLGPIKQSFYLVDGGTIVWTGSPYDANVNLQAYYKVRTNLGELSPELLTSGQQDINCYLNITESLMKPRIDFDIKAPKANEADKAILSQVTTNKDELNRQFFSLLLWRKFQPMQGSSKASGGAALDLVSQQINSLLSQVSQEYKLNVDMNSDMYGQNEYAVGIQKGFLDDQLMISGSFGARNSNVGGSSQASLIGDIEVEYKLNKEGTFRINVFNESNDTRVIQTQNRGQFKQGIGIYYKEDFHTFKDFKLLQKFLDVFRKKENKRYPIRRKKEQTQLPKLEEEIKVE